jgi:hypothetical protein
MKKYSICLITLFAIALAGCSTKNYNEREIIGRWFSNSWLRDGQETDMTAWFEFNEDKTYRAVIQRNQEEGTWWINGYKLFTKANGEEAIVVRIKHLDTGNLELEMNRGGQKEILSLSRGR